MFPKAGALRDWIVRRLARASAGVIATNHEDAARLRDLRMALIPIGSNIHRQCRRAQRIVSADRRSKPDDFLIANFGLINRSKGIDTLLESLAQLRADGIPARLVLIGGVAGSSDPTNAAYVTEIDALIERLDLAPVRPQDRLPRRRRRSALGCAPPMPSPCPLAMARRSGAAR